MPFALSALVALVLAQPQADAVDALIQKTMTTQHVPGIAVLIKKGDKVIKRKAYGLANVELEVPFKADTIFETGSIGKTFTALATMKLVEQGKLSLSAKLKDFFPQTPDAWSGITLQNLITHTSGLPEYVLFDGLRLDQDFERPKWWDIMKEKPLDFPTGTQFQYSNTNFYLLGLIVEKVSEKPFHEFVMDTVVNPCGLANTKYRFSMDIIPKLADGYFNVSGTLGKAGLGSDSSGFGAGGMVSTIDDLAKFLKEVRDGKVVSKETLAKMQQPNRLANQRKTIYGQGWFVRTIEGHQMLSHAGNSVGYSSSMAYFPDEDLTITLGSNVYAISGDGLAMQIAALIEPDLAPKKPVKKDDPNPALSAKLFDALKAVAAGDIKNDKLDADMQNRLATSRGQMAIAGMRQYSKIDSYEFCGMQEDAPDRIMTYRFKQGDRSFIARFTVTKDNKVYTVSVSPET